MPTTATTTTMAKSPFLHTLPPELRLHIYTHLLVAATPLKGLVARGSTKYALHTAILRVNRQIHDEASSVFFGRNVFYLSSLPPAPLPPVGFLTQDGGEEEEGSGAFEPPLQLKHLPLVRHLHIDLLYHATKLRQPRNAVNGGWKPVCVGAERYVTSVAYVLGAVEKTLLSLRLGADARRHAAAADTSSVSSCTSRPSSSSSSSTTASDEPATLDGQNILTSFHTADASPRFRAALAGLRVKEVLLRLDFPESYFELEVEQSFLVKKSLVSLVAQVLSKRGEISMRTLMDNLETEEDKRNGVCKMGDLAGFVTMAWSGEGVGRRMRLEG